MATFLTSLWDSVFTPGPTPPLLLATNAAFAALQALLAALLAATHSVHFVALSILSGGLWWAINWFARELAAAQAAEKQARRIRERHRRGEGGAAGVAGPGADAKTEVDWGAEGGDEGGMGDEGDGAETETEVETGRGRVGRGRQPGVVSQTAAATSTGSSLGVGEEATRRQSLSDAGELSTDSEWEKVDDP